MVFDNVGGHEIFQGLYLGANQCLMMTEKHPHCDKINTTLIDLTEKKT